MSELFLAYRSLQKLPTLRFLVSPRDPNEIWHGWQQALFTLWLQFAELLLIMCYASQNAQTSSNIPCAGEKESMELIKILPVAFTATILALRHINSRGVKVPRRQGRGITQSNTKFKGRSYMATPRQKEIIFSLSFEHKILEFLYSLRSWSNN